jgi:hypothetical protein
MVGEILEGTGDGFTVYQVFRLEVRAVSGEDESRFRFGGP